MTSTTLPTKLLRTDALGRVRTPPAEREQLLDLFEHSGLSGAAFARQHGIRYSTFAWWRQQRRSKRREAGNTQADGGGTQLPAKLLFQEVVIQPPAATGSDALRIELPAGACVHVRSVAQIPLAVELLRQLRQGHSC